MSCLVITLEGGDDIQTMKAGLMEIANVFVVNKAARPGADLFTRNLVAALQFYEKHHNQNIPVIKTIATSKEGTANLAKAIDQHQQQVNGSFYKNALLAERAYTLIGKQRMRDISKVQLKDAREKDSNNREFNLYRFVQQYITD
ncbi:LAO/AO transport system kinase [Filimonas lacunae]|uniref:LAO/AO transport system kinase n=1 Tax=Filimonas lacunae TaxID=477680 RepID=A0A173MQ82_9BACT|nr:hypothetical protein [Filimonas lacunae]BAV09823.1 periplasmic protein kinase ArgK and related GTPases of G3E family [Filimonas lacunae]SIS79489.1 LAO/AO transport system kinase [Filimonas lacunae]